MLPEIEQDHRLQIRRQSQVMLVDPEGEQAVVGAIAGTHDPADATSLRDGEETLDARPSHLHR